MPKVSVVIPIYNVEPYLRKALDSCINQTLDDIEFICVDDCSTDNSFEILKEYANNDKRFVIIQNEKNVGLGKTRNVGLKVVSGDYVMFLDPDDWFEPEACEKAYKQISKNNDDVVFFNTQTCDKDENVILVNKKLSPFKKFLDGETFSMRKVKRNFVKGKIACWSKIYSIEFLRKNDLYFPEIYRGEDIVFTTRLYLINPKVSVANYVLYNYRKQPQLFKEKEISMINDAYNEVQIAYKLVMQEPDNKFILKPFLEYFVDFCIDKRYYKFKGDNLSLNKLIYNKSRELLKIIDKEQNAMKFYDKIDIVKYRLFILCPNCLVYEALYNLLADKASIEKEHIVFNLGKIKVKLRIADKKFKKHKRHKGLIWHN